MIDETKNELPETSDLDRTKAHDATASEQPERSLTQIPPSESEKEAPAGADVQAYIGRQLRAVYDDVAKQPIPERFLALMKQLEEQAPKR